MKVQHGDWHPFLAAKAVIWLPYRSAIGTLTELHTVGVPTLLPSTEFLATLIFSHNLTNFDVQPVELTHPNPYPSKWQRTLGGPRQHSSIAGLRQWVAEFECYSLDHIIPFSSWEHLADLLIQHDFEQSAALMRRAQQSHVQSLARKWASVLGRLVGGHTHKRTIPQSYDAGLAEVLKTRRTNVTGN